MLLTWNIGNQERHRPSSAAAALVIAMLKDIRFCKPSLAKFIGNSL